MLFGVVMSKVGRPFMATLTVISGDKSSVEVGDGAAVLDASANSTSTRFLNSDK